MTTVFEFGEEAAKVVSGMNSLGFVFIRKEDLQGMVQRLTHLEAERNYLLTKLADDVTKEELLRESAP